MPMRILTTTLLCLIISMIAVGQDYKLQKLVPGVTYKVTGPKSKEEFITANRSYIAYLVDMAQVSIDDLSPFKKVEAQNLSRQLAELIQRMDQAGSKVLENDLPPEEYLILLSRIREDAEAQLVVWRYYNLELIRQDVYSNLRLLDKKEPKMAREYRTIFSEYLQDMNKQRSELYSGSLYRRYRKDFMTINDNLKRILAEFRQRQTSLNK